MITNNLTVVILTFNEEVHIDRAIINVKEWAQKVIVLDSGSTDKTLDIIKSHNVQMYYRAFDNYANQRNYAISNIDILSDWILFLDADEYLTEELKREIDLNIVNDNYNGFYLKRRFYFLGKWIKYGGYYPTYILRLFKKGKGQFKREINEYLEIKGKTSYLKNDFVDDNLKTFESWAKKHIDYAKMEGNDLFKSKEISKKNKLKFSLNDGELKRWLRYRVFNNVPFLLRPILYFIYIYIFRLGFLNGFTGFIYHFNHDFIYRFQIETFYWMNKKNKR
jgi:glycosyltransferase involved in cell wall biosynthesis